MKFHTTRFGEIEVKEEEFIYFKGPILGFERLTRFVLLRPEDPSPLMWLQSVDDPAVAFVVVNPRLVKRDYNPTVFESDLNLLGITRDEEAALLAIVTLRSQPLRMMANLRAPLLINAVNRLAAQVILADEEYPLQYDILDHRRDLEAGMRAGDGEALSLARSLAAAT
ncbi:MAG TPA: flagellar assembly protein FliW [Syntrophales bacterium]|nr:flagellar assembly protein FliW [Syntrophales bacterium]HOM06874.1 flagellar assembly protein FliW [Syntrophales bacterium]HON99391.1 flagellar assembly protein FliW [Syntrophales bacterium]HPC00572.1 flagellar assembly protein FliW [Syntrophales bacterium]HPQ06415.1 flagellar assembly protein FliW [Syntrophales bacterium]